MAMWTIVVKAIVVCIWLAFALLTSIFGFIAKVLDTATEYLNGCVKSFDYIAVAIHDTAPSAPELPQEIMSHLEKGEVEKEVESFDRMKLEVQEALPVPSTTIAAACFGDIPELRTISAPMGPVIPVEYVNGPTTAWKFGQKRKFYAVVRGFQPRIYETWDECNQQVWRFSDCKFKSFKTRAEAVEYMHNGLRTRGTRGMPHK